MLTEIPASITSFVLLTLYSSYYTNLWMFWYTWSEWSEVEVSISVMAGTAKRRVFVSENS